MTKKDLREILQKAEELASNDFVQSAERYDVYLTCMKLFRYLAKAMEDEE